MEPSNIIATLAFLISCIAVALSVGGSIHDLCFGGDAIPLTPPDFVIVNRMSVFPSDHIILPLEWYNSWRAKTEMISQPYLLLHKKGSNDNLIYWPTGEYPSDFSKDLFRGPYNNERSFIIPPNTVSKKNLAFKVDHWWDPNTNKTFHFKVNDIYKVYIGYSTWDGSFHQHPKKYLFNMTILPGAENRTEYDWKTFDLNRTTGETLENLGHVLK